MIRKMCVVCFFSSCRCASLVFSFFRKPNYLVYHCCVFKSFRIILNYKDSKSLVSYDNIRAVYYTVTNV